VSVGTLVTSGPLLLSLPVALVAGVVSFASPCMLPLVPGYLSYLAGLSGAELAGRPAVSVNSRPGLPAPAGDADGHASSPPAGGAPPGTATALRTRPPAPVARPAGRPSMHTRGRILLGAALFVLGFTAVFVAYGSAFGSLGSLLRRHERIIEQVLGAFTIALGLAFAGALHRLPWTAWGWQPRRRAAPGLLGAPLLGVLFAVSWTPCIGPTLAAVQSLALSSASAGRGAVLAAAYSLGLGIPFVATALAFDKGLGALRVIRRHTRAITVTGGALLVLTGLLELTGEWNRLVIELRLLIPASNGSPL